MDIKNLMGSFLKCVMRPRLLGGANCGALDCIVPLVERARLMSSVCAARCINAQLSLATLLALIQCAHAQPAYDFHDLGSAEWVFGVQASAINNSGQIVGWGLKSTGRARGVFWSSPNDNAPTEVPGVGEPSGDVVVLTAINDGGSVVGTTIGLAAVWTPVFPSGTFSAHVLPTLGRPYSLAFGINNNGRVVGTARTIDSSGREVDHAALWTPDLSGAYVITDLGILNLPNAGFARALAINATDQIGGVSLWNTNIVREFGTISVQTSHACFWDVGAASPTDLTQEPEEHSQALSINNAGKIVGLMGPLWPAPFPGPVFPSRAVVWIPDLGTSTGFRVVTLPSLDPTANNDSATSISNGDQNHPEQIVGTSAGRGVVWTASLTDPDTYSIQELSGPGVSRQATAINDRGAIVGSWVPTAVSVPRAAAWTPKVLSPIAVCTNVTKPADNNCQATVTAQEIDNGSFDPDGDPITLSLSPPGPYAIGITAVTLTVVDSKGASSTCSATVTVVDSTSPTLSCPHDIVQCNDPGQCGAVVNWPAPVAMDNCGVASVMCNPASGSIFEKGTTTVTCTATDTSGNTASCSFAVTVKDCEPPVVQCVPTTNPAGTTVPPAGANSANGQNPDGFYQLLAQDNCDGTDLQIYVKDSADGPCGGTFSAGPYAPGTKVKLTQSPGQASVKPMAGVIAAHINTRGNPVVVVTDSSGNTTCQVCPLPPALK